LELPLEIAALLQALNAVPYYFFLNAVRLPEEISGRHRLAALICSPAPAL
jgi:hypothetical protein